MRKAYETEIIKYQEQVSSFVVVLDKKKTTIFYLTMEEKVNFLKAVML